MSEIRGINDLSNPGPALHIALWIAQLLVAAIFISAGAMKLTQPIAALAAPDMMPWTGEVPQAFVRAIGAIDLAGGLGILLPALTRIRPGLTVLAALGCIALQICAMVFHLSRGEYSVLGLNVILLLLALFIWWGRADKAPIPPRR